MAKKTKPVVTITRPNGYKEAMSKQDLGDLVWNLLDHLTLQGRKLSQRTLSEVSDEMRKDLAEQFIFVLGFHNGESGADLDAWAKRNTVRVKMK
jgi:hypothetical protein